MAPAYFLGAYWLARREPIEECTDRLGRLLVGLSSCDPTLSAWYETGHSRDDALTKRVPAEDTRYLLDLLNRGRHRRDVGGEVIEDLGFVVVLWNGAHKPKAASLRVSCGQYWKTDNPKAGPSNWVVLTLPDDLGELGEPHRMARILAIVAAAWEPAWAGVMSDTAMDMRNFRGDHPFVDWMVYVPFKVDHVPEPSSLLELPGLGSIIMVQPTPPSVDNREDLIRIARIQRLVDEITSAS